MAVRGRKKETAANSRPKLGRTVRWGVKKPPEGLSAGAQAEYTRLVRVLEENGTLEKTDPRLVMMYAIYMDVIERAQAELQKADLVVTSGKGTAMPHPLLAVINTAALRVGSIILRLGLCPSAQKHGGSIEETKSEAPWGELLNLVS